jgi:predicted MFS family arabinose efflux permease
MHSAVPNLVEDAALERASGILQMAENTALLAGPVVAGALVASVGVEACYLLNAASFLLSGVAIAAIRGRFEESRLESPTSAGHWLQLRNGLTAARGLRPVRAFLVCGSLVMLGVAALNVGEVVFAREVLDAGSVGFGLLAASSGVGLITGSWIFIRASRAATAEQLYARGLFLASLGLLAAAISPSLPVAMAALAITGLGNGVYNGALLVTVQRTVADELRGRIFALLRGAFNVFLLSAMALAGPAMAAFGVRLVWVVGAAAILAASLLSGLLLRSVSAVAALPERA